MNPERGLLQRREWQMSAPLLPGWFVVFSFVLEVLVFIVVENNNNM